MSEYFLGRGLIFPGFPTPFIVKLTCRCPRLLQKQNALLSSNLQKSLKTGGYRLGLIFTPISSGTVLSWSRVIFCHLTHFDQSDASENIWLINLFTHTGFLKKKKNLFQPELSALNISKLCMRRQFKSFKMLSSVAFIFSFLSFCWPFSHLAHVPLWRKNFYLNA